MKFVDDDDDDDADRQTYVATEITHHSALRVVKTYGLSRRQLPSTEYTKTTKTRLRFSGYKSPVHWSRSKLAYL